MINHSNSSLGENLGSLDNPLRIKRKFSNMMNISKNIKQGIINNDLFNKKKNYTGLQENLLFEEEIAKELQFELKRRKNNNLNSYNDFIYKIENDLRELKIHRPENKNDNLINQNEIVFDNLRDCKEKNKVNTDFNNWEKCLDLGNCLYQNNSKFFNNINEMKNQISFSKEKSNILDNESLNNNDYILEDKGISNGKNINKYFNKSNDGPLIFPNNEFNKNTKHQIFSQLNNIQEDFEEKNKNFSFNEYFNDIDMVEFKNHLNNQNFYNSELIDLETINTSRNSNFDDLSISFITEYSNKNVSGNIISNAIETEKLMMKLFDICNPALQPTEKNVIILYSDMQKLKKRIKEIYKKLNSPNYQFSPMDLDFFNLMNNNASFSQIYSNLINNVTNEDEIMVDNSINCDNIDDKYDFSMLLD